eukprot:2622663-Alexandrium_andersonii.AAC.1
MMLVTMMMMMQKLFELRRSGRCKQLRLFMRLPVELALQRAQAHSGATSNSECLQLLVELVLRERRHV